MKLRGFILLLVAGLGFWLRASEKEYSELEAFVEEISRMRETLAHGVTGEVNAETFEVVCKPVGMRAKSMAQEKQWKFRQVSHKNRNPANKPTKAEVEAIERFEQDATLLSFWAGNEGSMTYYRRINVQKSCIACHGLKNTRPTFIKEKYPDDLAWGFKEGDLRGIFSVTPKTQN